MAAWEAQRSSTLSSAARSGYAKVDCCQLALGFLNSRPFRICVWQLKQRLLMDTLRFDEEKASVHSLKPALSPIRGFRFGKEQHTAEQLCTGGAHA